ncbi:ABC transporter permease [Bosea caraganae]|uniref:Transport permease protein n=1 Tax=Bosea caraganae TaxID=2763117 RepID=A0A370L6P3_9HYPH|nr:ABC transporter permease [Bosea caraganae]RDJ25406.1 ABC transporter permease [Bosea caraganae]RDJ25809.1 ABC transporter permease [Bosea caraganae]
MNKIPLSLISQLTVREVASRYRGSMLGLIWSLATPLFMLAVFTFFFAVVFQSRWGQGQTSPTEFGLIVFAGLTPFNLFAEMVSRAPNLVTAQPNLVKKVVFPLAVLPIVAMGSALFQAAIAIVVLLVFQITLGSGFHTVVLLLPLLVLPLCLFTLGVTWFLAALGVYVRDVSQLMPSIVTALMFLSPIFYPSSNLPEWIRPFAANNPLAFSIETVREAVIFGRLPNLVMWLLGIVGGLIVAALGYAFFQKTRKGFADVL